mgnify:FL=1
MDKIFNQIRRIYSDNGRNDVDFTDQEIKLRVSEAKLAQATQELVKASENLNAAAMGVDGTSKQMH